MILIAALTAIMFCGGWYSPFHGIPVIGEPSMFWLLVKMSFFLFCFLWFRATFPRYRYDQIMRLGWKVFIPITIVWLLLLGFVVVYDLAPWWFGKGGVS